MEILQLQYFFDTARTENFAKTAEKYFVPPSSVSASVKRLETELGCKLFDRKANKITLNENGRKLQRSLGIIFDELDSIKAEFATPTREKTHIKILTRSVRSYITNAIIDYRKNHTDVCFETHFDAKENNLEDYDLIIDEDSDIYTDFKKFELYSVRLRIKAAVDSPLCRRALTLSQLRNQNFITMGKDTNMHNILCKACKNAGFTPNIVMETNDMQCYSRCLASGMGIGLSREKLSEKSGNFKIESLQVTDFEERQTFYVYYKQNETTKSIQEFIDFLRCRNF